MRYLKQSTAVTIPIGPFLDATDGVTAETALTIPPSGILLSKANGTLAAKDNTTTATYDAAGFYRIELGSTVDVSSAGNLVISVAAAGAVPVWHEFVVLPGHVYDSVVAGTDLLDVNSSQFAGETITSGAAGTISLAAKGTMKVGLESSAVGSATFAADGITRIQSGLALSTQVDTLEGRLPSTITLNAGGVTVATNSDKTGYSLTQTFPTNFSATLIDAAGTVTTQAAGASVTVGSFAPSAAGQIATSVDASTSVAAIKAKTDSLTFTVANNLDANIQYVNDVVVTGSGTAGDPWGP